MKNDHLSMTTLCHTFAMGAKDFYMSNSMGRAVKAVTERWTLRCAAPRSACSEVTVRQSRNRYVGSACFLGVLSLGLVACSSSPVHYYTLVPPTASFNQSEMKEAISPSAYQISVLPVSIPEPLNRHALVVRQGQGEVAVLNSERWVGPLEDEIRLMLSQNLSNRLQVNDIGHLSVQSSLPVVKVKVDVRRFDAWLGHRVDLDANWTVALAGANVKAVQTICRTTVERSASGNYPQLIHAYQQALDQLASDIAQTVRLVATGAAVVCPSSP